MIQKYKLIRAIISALFWAIALGPSAWLLLFHSYMLRVRLELGYLPLRYINAKPEGLSFDIHEAALYLSGVFLAYQWIGVMLLVLLILKVIKMNWWKYGYGFLLFLMSYILGWISLTLSNDFLTWYLDS